MEFQIVCPNVAAGCGWCGSLHELEDHVKSCAHRPSQCLYCQAITPLNILDEHSQTCLSSQFESMLKMEESVSLSMNAPRHEEDELVQCQNADKCCPWQGRAGELKAHLHNCEMEEYRPSRPKKCRTH